MEDLTERDNIELILLDAEENEIKEKENLEKLLEAKADVIIIQPVKSKNKEIEGVLKRLKKRISPGAMDRILEDTKLDAYVTSNFRAGVEQAKYLTSR